MFSNKYFCQNCKKLKILDPITKTDEATTLKAKNKFEELEETKLIAIFKAKLDVVQISFNNVNANMK